MFKMNGGFCYTSVLLLSMLCLVSAEEKKEDDNAWYIFVIIAPIGGFVGWMTNVVALKMTFFPLEFVGIPFLKIKEQPFGLFGWQGIIPCKAGKMAGIAVDLMVGKLIDVKKVFQRLDPQRMAKELEPGMQMTMRQIVDNTAMYQMPTVWDDVPEPIKEDFYGKLLETVPEFFASLLTDVQDNIFDVFDIRDFAVRKMVSNKRLQVDMFLEVGAKEFKFIELSGFFFGFLFGLVQTVIYYFYQKDVVMPVAGFIVGFATNWVALKMIFEPIEPVYIGSYKVQGLFLKRQEEVSVEFAKLSAEKIFSPDDMWDAILFGPLAPKFEEYVRRHVRKSVHKLVGGMEEGIEKILTEHGVKTLEDRIADNIIQEIPNTIHLGYEYSQKAFDLETEIREKLKALPADEFEGVLHPVFEEDEIKLILVGAVLGLGVGFLQLLIP